QNVGVLDAAAGKLHAHPAPVLIDALEIPAEMVTRLVDGGAQQPLQSVPRGQDLPQRALVGDAAITVDGDTLGHLDTEVLGAGAARLQRLQEFGMAGDTGTAADQFYIRTLIDVDVPPDLAQERRRKQARHRAANNDGPPPAAAREGSIRHGARQYRPLSRCPNRRGEAINGSWPGIRFAFSASIRGSAAPAGA